MKTLKTLDDCREAIDTIDNEMIRMLNERMEIVKRVGEIKHDTGGAIYRPEREKAIIERLAAMSAESGGTLNQSAIEAIFLEIFAVSRNIELPERIAYLGPEGSFTHQAAESRFGAMSEYLSLGSIHAVFKTLESGRAKFGVVPIENSRDGVVGETLDLLAKSPVKIVAELYMAIHLAFATKAEHLSDIKRIYPEYDEDQGYKIGGFVWFQGWNDVVNGGVYPRRGQPGGYDKYSEWLAMLIRDVRRDLRAQNMPFVIGVLGTNGPIENVEKRYRAIHGTFRQAMAAPAALPEFQGNVIAVHTAPYWDMVLDSIAQKRGLLNHRKRSLENRIKRGEVTRDEVANELAEIKAELESSKDSAIWKRGASNAAYHYLGCAKTMALIGKGFAEAMLELQIQ